MKKTPLKRKTALKAKTSLKAKTALKQTQLKPKSSLKVKSKLIAKAPLKSKAGHASVSLKSGKPVSKLPSKKRSNGLVGKGRSLAQIEYHSQLVEMGCFACNKLGLTPTSKLCIHHIRGRNKGREGDRSEWLVICLCWQHHDPSTLTGGCYDSPSVHCNKHLFTETVGHELWCAYESFRSTGRIPPWLTCVQWLDYLTINNTTDQWCWILDNDTPKVRRSDITRFDENVEFSDPPINNDFEQQSLRPVNVLAEVST